MKYWSWWAVFALIVMLAWCGQSYPLRIQTLDFVWEAEFAVPLQKVSSPAGRLSYQERDADANTVLDSLVIEKVLTELPLGAYVQQSLNQLKLYGYHISEETTKKTQLMVREKQYLTLLKSYTIVNAEGITLYMAQYVVDLGEKLLIISYASDVLKQRKVFIQNIASIVF